MPSINPVEILTKSKNAIWDLIKWVEAYLEGHMGIDINAEFLWLCLLCLVVLGGIILLAIPVFKKLFPSYI